MESLIVGVFLLKSKESRVASRVAPSEDVSCRVFLCLLSHTHPFATLGFRHVYVCVHLCVCVCVYVHLHLGCGRNVVQYLQSQILWKLRN